jgi:hypothetical protein
VTLIFGDGLIYFLVAYVEQLFIQLYFVFKALQVLVQSPRDNLHDSRPQRCHVHHRQCSCSYCFYGAIPHESTPSVSHSPSDCGLQNSPPVTQLLVRRCRGLCVSLVPLYPDRRMTVSELHSRFDPCLQERQPPTFPGCSQEDGERPRPGSYVPLPVSVEELTLVYRWTPFRPTTDPNSPLWTTTMQPSLREKISTWSPRLSRKNSSLVGHLTNEFGWSLRRLSCLVPLLSFPSLSKPSFLVNCTRLSLRFSD